MQNIFVEFLPPWVETGLQPAFYDKESGTVLQQVARMYAKVNWLIRMFNEFSKDTTDFVNNFVDETNTEIARFENATDEEIARFEHDTTETVNDYIARFVALKEFVDDYFDNLDVQEEINNKLDDMLDQGTLQEIITAYIQSNVAWTFDSVTDMKLATNLINGSFAQTIGYHSANDGGSAIYKIRSKTVDDTIDDMFLLSLYDNTLIAELITNDLINVKQLGAYGDDTHDDTSVFQAAMSKHDTEIFIPSGTYLIGEGLELGSRTTLAGEGFSSILKCSTDLNDGWLITVPVSSSHCTLRDFYIEGDFKCNGIYDGKTTGSRSGIRTHIMNIKIYHCNNALYLNAMGSMVTDCQFYGDYNLETTPTTGTGIDVRGTDNGISNTRVSGFLNYGIYNNNGGNRYSNVKSYLNGTGVYLRGVSVSASILQSEENFKDNFNIQQLFNSTLDLISDEAGIEARSGDTIPTTLNNYCYLTMDYCRNVNIQIAIGNRIMNDETWSCAGYNIKMTRCVAVTINGTCQSFTDSTVYPQMIGGDNLAGNTVIVNGFEYPNQLPKQTVTLNATSATTLNSHDGDNYDLTIKPTSSGGVTMMWFSYNDSWNYLCVSNKMSEGVKITNMFLRYTVSGQNYSITLSAFANEITSNLSLSTLRANMADILANNETYQNFVTQGATITDKMIFFNCNLSTSVISNRDHIKGLIEVYGG